MNFQALSAQFLAFAPQHSAKHILEIQGKKEMLIA